MDRGILEQHLEEAERHIAQGEAHLLKRECI
jgi:hypothetical protein